jgi:hypothetical protein
VSTPPRFDARGDASLAEPHLDDAMLVRWLDGEPPSGDEPLPDGPASSARPPSTHDAALAAHAAACPACAARAAVLRHRRARLSALLAATDLPTAAFPTPVPAGTARRSAGPPARRSTRWARPAVRPASRLAAAAVLVIAATLAAQPVRRWLAAGWPGRLQDRSTPRPAPRATRAAPAAGSDARPTDVVVTFTPAPGAFTLRLDARPARAR